jgi:hypothetical protein
MDGEEISRSKIG